MLSYESIRTQRHRDTEGKVKHKRKYIFDEFSSVSLCLCVRPNAII